MQLSVSAKQRWLADDPSGTRSTSVIGIASAFKSLDLHWFAHHVLAFRVAGGWEDDKATEQFDAGGISGSTLSIAPGVTARRSAADIFRARFSVGRAAGNARARRKFRVARADFGCRRWD